MVISERDIGEKKTREVRFFLSSLKPCARTLLSAVRQHWSIENSLHWTLDMTFREDESRVRKEAAPANLAIVRHMALNILKRNINTGMSTRRKKLMAALDDKFRETLIRQGI